jgi:hypothetical protein
MQFSKGGCQLEYGLEQCVNTRLYDLQIDQQHRPAEGKHMQKECLLPA